MIDFDEIKNHGEFLPDDAYDAYWQKFCSANIKAKKLEFLQSYEFIDNNEDFVNGNLDKFVEFLIDFHKNAYGGKENIKRIHYVEKPIDQYLEMEYYTYLINEQHGQEIKITYDRSLFPQQVCDFVLFENGNLFILDFGDNDTWKGAWHVKDEAIIDEVSKWFDFVYEKSINFKSMIIPNEYIMQQLRNKKVL